MSLTPLQMLAIVLAVAAATFLERALPFVIFSGKRRAPAAVQYLGKVLPPAMAGLLIVYCLRNTSFIPSAFAWETAASLAVIVCLHAWKHSSMLSVFGGTAVYMLLTALF